MVITRPVQVSALLTEAFELLFLGHHGVTALLADKPASGFLQHGREIAAQKAVWTVHYPLSHLEPSRSPSFAAPSLRSRSLDQDSRVCPAVPCLPSRYVCLTNSLSSEPGSDNRLQRHLRVHEVLQSFPYLLPPYPNNRIVPTTSATMTPSTKTYSSMSRSSTCGQRLRMKPFIFAAPYNDVHFL